MEIESVAVPAEEAHAKARSSAARSCITCSKAKAKCVRLPGQPTCERCGRLKKECCSKEPVLRRRKTVKSTRTAQLEALEHKIEHLVNALSTSQTQPRRASDSAQLSPPLSLNGGRMARTQEVINSLCASRMEGDAEETPASDVSSSLVRTSGAPVPSANHQSPGSPQLDYHSLGVTLPEAEVLLDRYRRLMAPSLPFVIITPEMTAERLYETKPFLLHAIVTVTFFHDQAGQHTMAKQLMRDISERILMNREKSLGILQGLLVFIAWYHPHVFWGQQATILLHLAIAMCSDLNIERVATACPDLKGALAKAGHNPHLPGGSGTLDDHRALLGVYYVGSMASTSFKRLDSMQFTKYMDSCLRSLEQAKEYDSDLFLVQLVRTQRFIEEVHAVESHATSISLHMKAFSADLATLRQNAPCEDNIHLQMAYAAAQIMIWELSVNDLSENKTRPLRSYIDDLYHCIAAVKALLDVYFTIPVALYLTMPYSIWGQFGHAFIVLTKIASIELDGWDMKAFHETIDLSRTIDRIAALYDAVPGTRVDGVVVRNEYLSKWAARVRWMKVVYEAKYLGDAAAGGRAAGPHELQRTGAVHAFTALDTELADPALTTTGAVMGGAAPLQQPTPPDDGLSGDFFNSLDDNFWASFTGDADWNLRWADPPPGEMRYS